jgi:hypothetical protein
MAFNVAGNSKTYLGLQAKCPILTKFDFLKIFVEVSYIKFHGNLSSGNRRADTCRQTDGHDVVNRCYFATKHKNGSRSGTKRLKEGFSSIK